MTRRNQGQTVIEYTVLLIILMAVLLSMQHYIKRGFQGRWKSSVDDLGDQYDPRLSNSSVLHTLFANSDTQIRSVKDSGGYWTNRIDAGNAVEGKTGFISIGAEQ